MRFCYYTLATVLATISMALIEREELDMASPPEAVRAMTEEDDRDV